jgi:hypothetical protein
MVKNWKEMIKNLELTILKKENAFHVEPYSPEFHSVGYYYLLKLKKLKFPHATYIKIYITNRSESSEIKFKINEGVLYISLDFNLSGYLLLSKNDKIRFQCEMLHDILKAAFIEYV